jgi:hypothetical protein
MVIVMQCLQPLTRDMGVDLRRGDIGMAEQHLHHPQIGPVIQQVRGERMAQGVR